MRRLVPTVLLFALAACGSGASSAPPPGAPSAPASSDEGKAAPPDDQGDRAAAIDALTEREAKSGECSPEHEAALEQLVGAVEAGLRTKGGEDGKPLGLQIVGKRVLALGPDARAIEMSVSGRGTQVHVLAYAVRDVSIDVLAGTTAATTLRSPFQREPAAEPLAVTLPDVGRVTELSSDSRQVTIKPGEPLQIRLTGQGCAALVSALEP